jgi:hypothetical protein
VLCSFDKIVTMTAPGSLSVYLGSAAAPEGSGSPVVSAATLSEAAAASSSSGSGPDDALSALNVTLEASELSTAWRNSMDLASFPLRPDCTVTVTLQKSSATEDLSALHASFLLAGLVGTSERKEANGNRVLVASKSKKVLQQTGAAALLQARPLQNQPQEKKKNGIVSINLNEEEDEELIDEDDLLQTDLLAPPPTMPTTKSKDDCGGRQPCDNCTCGRADAVKAADTKPQKKLTSIPKTSCGKCGLGDAFRCASCPYLGKPAFKPGEEHLVLDLQDDL